MDRTTPIVNNEPYHVYNRGNNRQTIFHDWADYQAFVKKMEITAARHSVLVVAYVLMPNHYHLLSVQRTGGSISDMMEALGTSTAKRYNAKYKHVGHLFEGPYRYSLVATDPGVAEVARYIHLNPVRAGLVPLPEDWAWSDFRTRVTGLNDQIFRDLLPRDYAEFVRRGVADIAAIRRLLFEKRSEDV